MRSVRRSRNAGRGLLLASAAAALASCGGPAGPAGEREPVFPVRGTVLVRGRPAEGALVVFHPTPFGPGVARPNGRVGVDGSFAVGTYETGDGAPAGKYAVTVTWPATPAGPMPDPDLAPDRLRGRYGDPKTSTLRASVREAENVLEPFELR